MAKEIEYKFLVVGDSYRAMAREKHEIAQGYLATVDARGEGATVRVRRRDDSAFITVKGPNRGATRDEWEYPVSVADAAAMLASLCKGTILSKTRYIVDYGGFTWEVDEFHGPHQGLVIAEVEVPREGIHFPRPPFLGEEVTGDPRYYNSALASPSL